MIKKTIIKKIIKFNKLRFNKKYDKKNKYLFNKLGRISGIYFGLSQS